MDHMVQKSTEVFYVTRRENLKLLTTNAPVMAGVTPFEIIIHNIKTF